MTLAQKPKLWTDDQVEAPISGAASRCRSRTAGFILGFRGFRWFRGFMVLGLGGLGFRLAVNELDRSCDIKETTACTTFLMSIRKP